MSRSDWPISQQELFAFLDQLGIETETIEHAPAMTVQDTYGLKLPDPVCKNLFLKDRRKKLWLLIALPDTKIHLKKLAKHIDAPELRFTSPELLYETLGVRPGAVTLFALLNDTENKVTVLLDRDIFSKKRVGFHPYHHSATTFIRTDTIHPFIRACGSLYQEMKIYDEA